MADPQSFYKNLSSGVPPPQVDPDDMKRVWEYIGSVQAKLPSRQGKKTAAAPPEHIGIHYDLLAQHCSPGANVSAVMFRCQVLGLLIQQGLLAPWLDGDNPSEFLFGVFATYPVHVGEFDTASLLQHIQEKSRG